MNQPPQGFVFVSKDRVKRVVAAYAGLGYIDTHAIDQLRCLDVSKSVEYLRIAAFVSDGDLISVSFELANVIYWITEFAYLGSSSPIHLEEGKDV